MSASFAVVCAGQHRVDGRSGGGWRLGRDRMRPAGDRSRNQHRQEHQRAPEHVANHSGRSYRTPCWNQTLRWARTTSSVRSPMGPRATPRPLSRMQNSLATRRANGSFCSTRSTGQALVAIQPQEDVADLVHQIRLNPFGGLIEDEQRRLKHERAPDGELLLLAAGEISAAAVAASSSGPGTARKCGPESARGPSGRTPSPMRRFSSTVSCGKISRPCGTYPMPRRARASVGSPDSWFHRIQASHQARARDP